MARIVYGVSGEGSGHSSRAREMAGHLCDQGHTVRLVSYDRGYENLKDRFDVVEAEGLCIASEDNQVSHVGAEAIGDFLYRLPDYGQRLEAYEPGDNSEIKAKLDELLEDDCALARRFHEERA